MKTKESICIYLFIFTFLNFLSSCDDDKGILNFNDNLFRGRESIEEEEDLNLEGDDLNLNPSVVTFNVVKSKIFDSKCLNCHGSKNPRAGVDLSTYESTLGGSTQNGKVVVANNAETSLLYLEVFNGDMPPKAPLTEEEISLIKDWINSGALNVVTDQSNETNNRVNPPAPVEPSGIDFKTLEVNYLNLDKYILKDKCVSCHSGEGARAGVDLSNYDSLFYYNEVFLKVTTEGDPEASLLYTEVLKGHMPPKNPLPASQVEYIRRWIEEGAIYEAPQVLPLADIEANYKNLSERILQEKCIGCHSGEDARAGVDLSRYESLFEYNDVFLKVTTKGDPEASLLYTEVFKGHMPPRKPLVSEEIAFIKRWIEEGAIE